MSDTSDSPEQYAGNARKLIEQTGILRTTQIICDLNLERDREQSTFESVLLAIAKDEPLATRVIQLANSAWFGGRVKVDSVDVAFGRLGNKDFYKAAMGAALRFGLGEGTESSRWWEHSESIAHLCEMVAQHLNPDLIEISFQAGLLRDCAVPLMTRHVTDYGYLADEALGFAPGSMEMETECNHMDHCTLGAVLFGDSEEDALRSEIARAFEVTVESTNDAVTELMRLYRLRQKSA
jgi:HD-like signal output (HDOD) protein